MSTLRLLLVEDSEDDALLLLNDLADAGFQIDVVRVETVGEIERALDNDRWDIVIAAYSMPRFGALQALDVVQQRRLDIPFLIVSGTIGEDIAVAAMRAGAHDYILKGNLARLIPAVE